MRDRPAQERIDALNQIMGSYLDQAGRLPPASKINLRKYSNRLAKMRFLSKLNGRDHLEGLNRAQKT
jgi:hypothetical protein